MTDQRNIPLPGPLRRIRIEVVFGSDETITANALAYYNNRPTRGLDLDQSWYKLGPEDKDPDGTVNRDRLGIIFQDLVDPFLWTAIDIEREGQH